MKDEILRATCDSLRLAFNSDKTRYCSSNRAMKASRGNWYRIPGGMYLVYLKIFTLLYCTAIHKVALFDACSPPLVTKRYHVAGGRSSERPIC